MIETALEFLKKELHDKEPRASISFAEYLNCIQEDPHNTLRNIFQLFYDMVKTYVHKEDDDSSVDDPESIGFVRYDCTQLFVEGTDNPFFADTPFANRFMQQVEALRQGFQQNRIYVYDGPSGSGKSTFLNNLLRTFETYTNLPQGQIFEVTWEIDEALFSDKESGAEGQEKSTQKLLVPCPSHDYPILLIPKDYRSEFLERLLSEDEEMKDRIFNEKEYEWIFRGEACTICKSIFWALFEKLGSIEKVLKMVLVRNYRFDRRVGEGVSIFNPGDKPFSGVVNGRPFGGYFSNKQIQDRLDEIFGVNAVRYIFSPLAKTNNGVYSLMDVKGHNKERLLELHNVISEGVHKVGEVEENIHSLFFALMNPEDMQLFKEEHMESFQGRIQSSKILYVLEPITEANIYRNIFGKSTEMRFLPRVLENFARVIIASRIREVDPGPLKEWIPDMSKYKLYCDEAGLLLRMELYSSSIPSWLSEEDRKNFTAERRKAIIYDGENEGEDGFSGRESIAMFSDFFGAYSDRESLINMGDLVEFFKRGIAKDRRDEHIPKKFLASLTDSYDYAILNEIQEALYFYSKDQIKNDILNYLCAVSYDVGDTVRCSETGEEIEVTLAFLILMASRITGKDMSESEAIKSAKEVQKKHVVNLASRQVDVTESDLYQDLFDYYVRNLKDQALRPFVDNKNFPEAIKAFGTEDFDTFDTRLKNHVSHMITNLVEDFGYSDQGAKEICLYALDNNLAEKFYPIEEPHFQPFPDDMLDGF